MKEQLSGTHKKSRALMSSTGVYLLKIKTPVIPVLKLQQIACPLCWTMRQCTVGRTQRI